MVNHIKLKLKTSVHQGYQEKSEKSRHRMTNVLVICTIDKGFITKIYKSCKLIRKRQKPQ